MKNDMFPSKKGGRPLKYDPAVILQCKALFLSAVPLREIAEKTGVDRTWLKRHANFRRWPELRTDESIRVKELDTARAQLADWQELIATQTQSLSLASVDVVRDAIDRGSARDLKDSASGLKTLVEVARLTSGAEDGKAPLPLSGGVNMFFFAGKAERIEKPVETVMQSAPAQLVSALEEPDFG